MKSNSNNSPMVGVKILKLIIRSGNYNYAIGDYLEIYNSIRKSEGLFKAWMWFWVQVLCSLPRSLKNSINWSAMMFKNYLKIAFRNIIRHKGYMFINLFGLAVGFAIFILSTVFSVRMMNGDTFHENFDRMYGVVQVNTAGNQPENHSAILPAPVMPALQSEFPQIEDATRFFKAGRKILGYDNRNFYEGRVRYVDANFLSFFSFEIISGHPETMLSEPYSIVLTESRVQKYFGNDDPIGKVLTLDNEIDLTVTGVTKNSPDFSGFQYDFLISMETLRADNPNVLESWKGDSQAAILLLKEGFNANDLNNKLTNFVVSHFDESPESPDRMYLFPMKDFLFDSNHIKSLWNTQPILAVYVFIGMGILILIVACINFMNLSTARYSNRAKEVGLRKVVGAQRHQVVKQFLGESVLMSMIALPIGIILFEIIRPLFQDFYDNTFVLSLWADTGLLVNILFIAVFVGIFAGSYPAFFLSSFRPVQILQEKIQSGKKGNYFRKFLVVSQFALSIVLIIFTVVISRQFDFLIKTDLGYNRENTYYVPTSGLDQQDFERFKASVRRLSNVEYAASSSYLPGLWESTRPIITEGMEESEASRMDVYNVGINLPELMQMTFLEGRPFSKEFSDEGNFIITQSGLELLEMEDPVGKQLTIDEKSGKIVGVVSDFNFRPFHRPKTPAILRLYNNKLPYMFVKTTSAMEFSDIRDNLSREWKQIVPDQPFGIEYYDDAFARWQEGTEKGSQVCGAIGVVTIFVSCLGLFGLASFTVEKKRKEIGVRKVLGASTTLIIKMLVKNFLLLVAVANLTAWPIGYFLSRSFIDNMYFDYPIEIGYSVYIFAALITLISGVFAIFSQTLKAAQANPADSLRYE